MRLTLDSYIFPLFQELCSSSDQPKIFLEYFKFLASMKSSEYPKYEQLKKIFGEGLTQDELKKDSLGIFDSL